MIIKESIDVFVSMENQKLLKILIVDDETDICYLLSRILKNRGNVETNFVNTLSEATKSLEEDEPALMFLDNHLPDGAGINYIEYVKETHPDTKIIMITAHDTPLDRKSAMNFGADAFIGKPFTRDLIYQTVEQFTN